MDLSARLRICVCFAMALAACTTGCSVLRLSQEVDRLNHASILIGTIRAAIPLQHTPVIVLAYQKGWSTPEIAHATHLHEPGPFELIVPRGRYRVFAFGDLNNNRVYDAGEPAGEHPIAVITGGRAILPDLDVTLEEVGRPAGGLSFGTVAARPPVSAHSTLPGATADLNDTLFSFENGRRGYWEPYSFFRDTGCNIYFLHPHDPAKIPVLFVHGAMGSPRGWRFLSRHMDSSRFQPWFYYYPSGAPLQCAADLLHRKLVALRDRHRFDRMVIVAHSMGGLVVRSALVHHHGDLSFVRAFISIATPWDGVSRVVPGINISPVVLPSWKDLQPDGPFARSIFCRDLPESVDHYLFFGFKQGGRSEWGSDGVVGLTTQLKPRSQREAAGIFGFHEDHSGMLRSFSVLERFNRVLDKAWNDRPAGT